MKINVFSLLVMIGLGTVVNAQTTGQFSTYTANTADGGVSDALYNYAMGDLTNKYDKAKSLDAGMEGSPYESNSFAPAQLYFGEELVGNLYYRYNAYNEEIEIKQQNLEGEAIKGLSKDKKIRVLVNGKSRSFKTFIDKNGNTQNGYLTLLKDGKYKLYEHLGVVFKEAQKAQNTLVKSTPAKFSQFTEYYLESPDGSKIQQLQLNNKKLLKIVGADSQEELAKFLKTEKLKIKEINDLYQVMDFLNQ
ncbi:MAG: hypothetical protein AAF717_10305 [Bacteroidota bacterium]